MTRKDDPGALWRKSRHSNGSGSCTEVGQSAGAILVRDTKLDRSPVLAFRRDTWRTFTDQIKHGQNAL